VRCRREIADTEAEIRAGNTDVDGLCLALADWCGELRIIHNEKRRRADTQRRERSRTGENQALTE
jgi:hypothetical protein